MKKFTFTILTVLLSLMGLAPALAQSTDFSGKMLKLGSAVTTLETGKWYFLFNSGTGAYAMEGSGNTLTATTTNPNGLDAESNAGYLVQLESAGSDGKYYLKSGLGNYYRNVTTTKCNGTESTTRTSSIYTIAQFNTAGHWTLKSNSLYYLQCTGSSFIGSSGTGSALGDRDWVFYEASLTGVEELQGQAYVKYVLNKGGLVRLTNRRNSNANLSDNGTNTEGTGADNSSLNQVWILAASGSGYTLRNGQTGNYLNDDDNFRTPSSSATTIYIQYSPNNTETSSYINLSEESSFGSKCLNLNTDGTSLYKWSAQGDYGSDWTISLVSNFTLAEVEANILAQSNFVTPEAGKYYRIKNKNYKTYMTENISSNVLSCESQNDDKLAQYWTVVQTGTTYALQNLCTQRYIMRQGGTLSQQYKTQASTPATGYTFSRSSEATDLTYYIVDNGTVGLHCNSSSNLVGWYTTGIAASTWGFEEVELTDEFIQQGREQLSKYSDLMANIDTYKAALRNLFQDNACTTLRDSIQNLTDEQLAQDSDYAVLSDDLKATVLKVKNNTWESFTASDGYSRPQFEKFFRVRDDYQVYSNYQKMAWNEYCGMSNAFGKLSGPTGIVGKSGDIIYFYVDEEPSADCTLQAEVVTDSDSPGDHPTGTTTNLHAGLNAVVLGNNSTVYIFYQLNDPEKYLANYPDMKIHIEGGELQGYFDLTRGMTNADWRLMREKMLNKNNILNMKGKRIVFAMLNNLVQEAVGSANEMEGLVRVWSAFPDVEESLMGFNDKLAGRFNNIWNAFSVNHGYMYATTYGTYYHNSTLSTVLNYNTITTSGGAIWGPSHEMGHNHQACFNIIGATEVSNNLFSNANVYTLGVSTTRGASVTQTLEDHAAGKGWFEMSIWEQTRFYYQLFLYFHAQGHNPQFYPTLFTLLRQDPISKRSSDYDGTVEDSEGNKGGYLSYGKDDYLHMAKKMCDAAQLDLSELFEVYGMFKPYDKYYVGDYSNYWVVTTQQDIDEAKAYMHKYPKAPSICFIDDRIKPSAVIKDSPLEGQPSGEYRVNYDDEVSIGYADVGQWSDYVDDYQTQGYYYTSTTSEGVTTYSIQGEGAIGFKVYDKDGNLVYLSNKKKFSIPDNILTQVADGFTIVACEGNGYEVQVPYGPAMYRGTMTVYYEGGTTPHTVYYYGTGTAGESHMNPLPANSIAYVKAGQSTKKQPSGDLLSNLNVVDGNGVAKALVIDGDKDFYLPTAFTADSISFTKSGTGYQALSLPFDVTEGYVGTIEGEKENDLAETISAGSPVIVKDAAQFTCLNAAVSAGTYTTKETGYILNADKTAVVAAEGITPFTYVWESPFELDNETGIEDLTPTLSEGEGEKAIYNLAGQRVSKAQKGIYIVGGRKVLK